LGYNCRIMLKRLAIVTVVAFFWLSQPLVPVPGQSTKSSTENTSQGHQQSQSNQQPSPPAPLIGGVEKPVTANPNGWKNSAEDKQEQPTAITTRSPLQVSIVKNYPPVLQYIYDWGPWAFALALVIVGALQIVLLRRTWRTIERQADIQTAGMQQWVEVQVTKSECEHTFVLGGIEYKAGKIDIWFSASNQTDYPLTIQKIFVKISGNRSDGPAWEPYIREEKIILSPGRGKEPEIGKRNAWEHRFFVTIDLDAPMIEEYKIRQFVASVSGRISFKPAVGPSEEQWFGCLVCCGPDWASIFSEGSELEKAKDADR
jgi:hypothetical protein